MTKWKIVWTVILRTVIAAMKYWWRKIIWRKKLQDGDQKLKITMTIRYE